MGYPQARIVVSGALMIVLTLPGMPVLDVAPAQLRDAAGLVGDTSATLVRLAWVDLQAALEECVGMAGTDPAGVTWGDAYDLTAASISQAATDLLNSCSHVGALLDQTGINYARAEQASAQAPMSVTRARFGGDWCDTLGGLPESIESGIDPPGGWSVLAQYIARAWPNGHQDRLHRAAALWQRAASQLRSVHPDLGQAKSLVLDQRSAETDAAATVIDELAASLDDLADGCASIATACTEYAHHLDAMHHQVISELESFLAWSAGIQAAGGLFAVISAGASEAVAQAAEEGTAIKYGKTIATIIDALVTAARTVAAALTAIGPRIAAVVARVRPILARHMAEVRLAMASEAGEIRIGRKLASQVTPAAATTAEGKAVEELEELADVGPAAATWGDLRTLPRHVADHGRDFGVTTQEAYAELAARFRLTALRRRYLCKINKEDGTVMYYDPASNTFGVYRLDGRARTLFKPTAGRRYFDRQPGVIVHG